jgi:hypothetical protein
VNRRAYVKGRVPALPAVEASDCSCARACSNQPPQTLRPTKRPRPPASTPARPRQVFITDPELAAKVTARVGGIHRKGLTYIGFDAGNNLGHRSFFSTQDEAAWLLVRKGCAPAFSPSNIRCVVGQLEPRSWAPPFPSACGSAAHPSSLAAAAPPALDCRV